VGQTIAFCRLSTSCFSEARQDRKTTLNRVQVVPWVGQALPPANRSGSDQELAGESACPTFFHGISRAVGPFKQGRKNRIEKPLAWPAFRPAGKLKHAPPKASVFHGISRAEGPFKQTTKGDGLSYPCSRR
jgi:hypothetical protein